RVRQPQPAVAAREQGRGDLREVPLDGLERLGEAAVDRLRELVPELGQLLQRPLQILALHPQLAETGLLRRVFLLRERVDAAQLLAPPLASLQLLPQLRPLPPPP